MSHPFPIATPTHQTTPTRLAPKALYQEVAEQLRERIFNGVLAPGSWIDELAIAQELGISRTPLREAIKVLAAEGLVTMKVRRGAYVTEVSERDLAEVYHLLSVLESDAAAEAARLASEDALQELQHLHAQLESAASATPPDTANFFRVNEQFHLQLLHIADNRWRTQMVVDLRKVLKLNRHHSLLKGGRIEQSLQEHRALLQALLEKNCIQAAQKMQIHFANGLVAAK
jgi:DNA-binding GntR family transcriptional regulator